jgi:hypothetical protein
MLIWNKELWLIDFGASLYFHHAGTDVEEASLKPFVAIKDHVLLPAASLLQQVDAEMKAVFTPDAIKQVVALVPDVWLSPDGDAANIAEARLMYEQFLNNRCKNSSIFLNEALHAQQTLI